MSAYPSIGAMVDDAERRAPALTFGERMALDDFVWLYNRGFTVDQRRHLLALRALHEARVLTEWPPEERTMGGWWADVLAVLVGWCALSVPVALAAGWWLRRQAEGR